MQISRCLEADNLSEIAHRSTRDIRRHQFIVTDTHPQMHTEMMVLPLTLHSISWLIPVAEETIGNIVALQDKRAAEDISAIGEELNLKM